MTKYACDLIILSTRYNIKYSMEMDSEKHILLDYGGQFTANFLIFC